MMTQINWCLMTLFPVIIIQAVSGRFFKNCQEIQTRFLRINLYW
jgi:hypothetical protein